MLASQLRFAVFAGADAAWYLRSQCGDARPPTETRIDLVLRWAEEGDGWEPTLRTEREPYDWSASDSQPSRTRQGSPARGAHRKGGERALQG